VVKDINAMKAQIFQAPLDRRAWVVQERLLSPRILHFGESQIFWDCNERFACEDWPKYIPRSLSYPLGRSSRRLEDTLQRLHEDQLTGMADISEFKKRFGSGHFRIYSMWSHIVELYTGCDLTKGDDKLVALSGVARLFKDTLQDDYLAGMWKCDLHYGGWYVCTAGMCNQAHVSVPRMTRITSLYSVPLNSTNKPSFLSSATLTLGRW